MSRRKVKTGTPQIEATNEIAADVASVIQQIQQGDREMLAVLFSQFRPRLHRFVEFRLNQQLRGRLDPEDVLQECWLRAVARIEYFPESISPAGFIWFRMILMQTLIDLQRHHLGAGKRDVGRESPLQQNWSSGESSRSLAFELSARLTSPSGALARGELAQQLSQALQNLDEADREILALRHYEELTNAEAAMTLNLSEKTASKRYVRALRRLKEILQITPGMSSKRL